VLVAASDRKADVIRAEEQCRNLTQQQETLNLRVERAETLAKQVEKARVVKDTLSSTRDVFHRGQLPQLLARRFISAIDSRFQSFLSMMQSNFTAGLTQQEGIYRFSCTFDDTSTRDASSLSGGEKARFSLGFLLAVNEVMSSRLGVLALDEPTAQLDEHNVQCFTAALQHVQGYAHSAGVQIFLITHCKQLEGAFDQTISL